MWKLTSWAFRKCGSFWDLEVLNHSYGLSKSGQISIKKSMWNGRYEKKTRPQYWFLGHETNSRAFSHGGEDLLFVSGLKTHYCGRVFFYASYFRGRTSFFRTHPSLTAYNSRSKPHTPNKFHIFGNVRTWGFTSSHPGYFSLWANFEEWSLNEKMRFYTFFCCRTEEIFKRPPIGKKCFFTVRLTPLWSGRCIFFKISWHILTYTTIL